MNNPHVAFVGAGNMASSLIGGLLSNNFSPDEICASAPSAERRAIILGKHGIKTFQDNSEAIKGADVVLLAVKPQVAETVCRDIADSLPENILVMSIAAGVSCNSLQRWLHRDGKSLRPIVRCMPNTPSLVRQGVSGLFANSQVNAEHRQVAEQLLSSVGVVLWLEEEVQFDAVTALSGSGPAYYFLLMEAMIAAGIKLGLSREAATCLTIQTGLGAAHMAGNGNTSIDELRLNVTSPNGTTEAAIREFEKGGFKPLVEQALDAAARRSAELSATWSA